MAAEQEEKTDNAPVELKALAFLFLCLGVSVLLLYQKIIPDISEATSQFYIYIAFGRNTSTDCRLYKVIFCTGHSGID